MGRNANKANAGTADKASAPKEEPKTETPVEENPLESAIQDQTPPAEQSDAPTEQADTGGSLADDEQPAETEAPADEQDDEVPLGVEPPEIELKPIPTPTDCLSDNAKYAGYRFLGLTSPSKMTSGQIKAELEFFGNPMEKRAQAADALGAAKLERARLIAELDQKIAQLDENLWGVTGWAYAAEARVRQLTEHQQERTAAQEKAAEDSKKAAEAKKAAKAATTKSKSTKKA